MKKLNNKGFILAETLVVSIFLTVVFTMIYSNFYPIIGEYEKRESYDDVDGKYAAYWIKRMIESDSYVLQTSCADDAPAEEQARVKSAKNRIQMMNELGYMRFECSDISELNNQREICKGLVNLLEVSGCDGDGNGCDIFITRYQIGGKTLNAYSPDFKNVVRASTSRRYDEFCYGVEGATEAETNQLIINCTNDRYRDCCISKGLYYKDPSDGITNMGLNEYDYTKSGTNRYPRILSRTGDQADLVEYDKIATYCQKYVLNRTFNTATKDYILSLPNYSRKHMTTSAKYRVIMVFHHTKDDNDFYSFSTMEVKKNSDSE